MVEFCECIYKGTEHPHEHCPSKLRGSTCVHECVKAQAKAIAAKDAEIVDLKDKNTEAFKAVLKRDALVKELADALLSFLAILHNPCSVKQCREECSVKCREMSALVAKAREVLNEASEKRDEERLAFESQRKEP